MGERLDRLPEYLDRWQVPYVLLDGWETRSRASGDFVAVMAVGWHHTASKTTPERDLGWMYFNEANTSRPVGNCLIDRTGVLHLAAVKAVNTQGRGGPYPTTSGIIPADSGNSRIFAIEVANDGVGEEWPDVQLDAYLRATCAVIECVNETVEAGRLSAGDVLAHFEWTRGRKWDPAGPVGNAWADESPAGWSPYPGARLWDMDKARGEIWLRLLAGAPTVQPEPVPVEPAPEPVPAPVPAPEPPDVEDDDMMFIGKTAGFYWIADGIVARRVTEQTANSWIARRVVAGRPLRSIREPAKDVTTLDEVPSFSSNAVQSLGQIFAEPVPAS